MITATMREALWFLPFAIPIGIWVALSDMKSMKIPNKAVLALTAVFAVVGLFVLPLPEYGIRWLQLAVVLAVGFVLTILGTMGAGDAKFLAAMAPFIAYQDWRMFCAILFACLLGAFAVHRGARAIPAVRAATPDWVSWTHKKFPMGLALAAALIFHLAIVALRGV